jgi:hypothetical protein
LPTAKLAMRLDGTGGGPRPVTNDAKSRIGGWGTDADLYDELDRARGATRVCTSAERIRHRRYGSDGRAHSERQGRATLSPIRRDLTSDLPDSERVEAGNQVARDGERASSRAGVSRPAIDPTDGPRNALDGRGCVPVARLRGGPPPHRSKTPPWGAGALAERRASRGCGVTRGFREFWQGAGIDRVKLARHFSERSSMLTLRA